MDDDRYKISIPANRTWTKQVNGECLMDQIYVHLQLDAGQQECTSRLSEPTTDTNFFLYLDPTDVTGRTCCVRGQSQSEDTYTC